MHKCHRCKCTIDVNNQRYKVLSHNYDATVKMLCKRCYSRYYCKCVGCGNLVEKKGAIVTLASSACCEDHLVGIKNYGFKPNPVFVGLRRNREDFYVGIEIEVAGPKKSDQDLQTLAKNIEKFSGGVLYCKSDSSINHGFEIVSMPIAVHSLLDGRKIHGKFKLQDILEYLQLNGMEVDESCGIHMHIDLRMLDDLKHRYRFCSLFLLNEEEMFSISGRDNRDKFMRYAGCVMHESMQELVETGRKKERHSIINLNGKTLELRMFQGTLEYEKILEIIYFLKGSLEFTRTFKNSKITTDVSNLVSYLVTNYPIKWNILDALL